MKKPMRTERTFELREDATRRICGGGKTMITESMVKEGGVWKVITTYKHYDDSGKLDAKTVISGRPFSTFDEPSEYTTFY